MMEQEIIVGKQYGSLTFSFKTDRKGGNLKEGFEAINELISSNKRLLESVGETIPAESSKALASHHLPLEITLSELQIPLTDTEGIILHISTISRFDLFILLLHYAKRPLGYAQVMSLSKELGKPIRYNWLDSEPHRKQNSGYIKSDSIPGKKEKLYSLTERGKQRARDILKKISAKD